MEPTIKDGSYIICLNTVGHLRDAFQNEFIVLGRALTSVSVRIYGILTEYAVY